jgi:5'-3' exonuclease
MTKVLLDASNAWYRSYLATVLDPPGGPVMIMTYMLRKLCQQHGRNNVVVCWDGGDGGRKKLDPEYKGQRTSRPGVWEDIVYMYRMVDCLGIPHSQVVGHEADDVIGSLAIRESEPVWIHSFDKDFYQLVTHNIQIFRPERKMNGKTFPQQIIDEAAVREEFGCDPNKVVIIKAFQGDSSDNIPRISIRFTQNFLKPFYGVIARSSSVSDFYEKIGELDEKYHEDLLAFKERALLNEKLVQINTTLNVTPVQTNQDFEAFTNLCTELEITRLKATDWQEMPTTTAELPPVQNSLF